MKYLILILAFGIGSLSSLQAQSEDQPSKQSAFFPKPQGLLSFGKGIGGPKGRNPIRIKEPEVPEHTESISITYHFEVLPDGSIGEIDPPISEYPTFAKAGIEAIKVWEFTPDLEAEILKKSVTITFSQK